MSTSTSLADAALFTAVGLFYPRGHVFAMFDSEAHARAAAERVRAVHGIGSIQVVDSATIVARLAEPPRQESGLPSLGREHQFMRRFVELAREGMAGLLVERARADADELARALQGPGAQLAYHYRALVIEELLDSTPRAQAAASGRL